MLQGDGDILYHCPVGVILRDHPWAYDAIAYAGYAEQLTPPQFARLSPFAKATIQLVNSERARLREIKTTQRRAAGASAARLRAG